MSEFTNHFRKWVEAAEVAAAKKKLQDEFLEFDCGRLSEMTDQELATWQAQYPMDSPQYIFATQEWNRRLIVRQIKSVKFTAIITAVASIIAALLGAWVGATLTRNQSQMQQQSQSRPSITHFYKSPVETNPVRPIINKPESQKPENIKQ